MSLRLVAVEGPARGAQLLLDDRSVVEVGSAQVADLVLPDPRLAGIQLKLYREGDAWSCYDVTGQGFAHNQRPTRRARLAPGDAVALPGHTLRLLTDSPQEVPVAPPTPPPRLQPGWGVLRVLRGNDAGRLYPLGEKSAVIMGRGASADICVWDIRASRAHCRIDRAGEGFRLSDLNSSNGTRLNGERLTASRLLQPGDRIAIGSTELQFGAVRPRQRAAAGGPTA